MHWIKTSISIEVDDYDQAEKDVDEIFKAHQVGNTEVFACNIERVIKALSSFNGRIIFPANETKKEIVEKVNKGISKYIKKSEHGSINVKKRKLFR